MDAASSDRHVREVSVHKSRDEVVGRLHSRRSMLQIRMEILRIVMGGFGKPTQIMYKANLSWTTLQSQLRIFVRTDLLEAVQYGSRRKYVITEKGVEIVKSYEKVIDEILEG